MLHQISLLTLKNHQLTCWSIFQEMHSGTFDFYKAKDIIYEGELAAKKAISDWLTTEKVVKSKVENLDSLSVSPLNKVRAMEKKLKTSGKEREQVHSDASILTSLSLLLCSSTLFHPGREFRSMEYLRIPMQYIGFHLCRRLYYSWKKRTGGGSDIPFLVRCHVVPGI